MSKTVIRISLLTMLVVGLATAGAAAFYGIAVGGVNTQDGKLDPFFYLEGTILDSISIGVGGHNDVFGASLWLGSMGGPYGEVVWVGGGSSPATAEVGLWRGFELSNSLILYGWAGVNHQLGGGASALALTLNGEAHIGLSGPLSVVVGGGTNLVQGGNVTNGYVGLGYNF